MCWTGHIVQYQYRTPIGNVLPSVSSVTENSCFSCLSVQSQKLTFTFYCFMFCFCIIIFLLLKEIHKVNTKRLYWIWPWFHFVFISFVCVLTDKTTLYIFFVVVSLFSAFTGECPESICTCVHSDCILYHPQAIACQEWRLQAHKKEKKKENSASTLSYFWKLLLRSTARE